MSTHSLDLTLVGWIGSDVRHYPATDGGTPFTSFRMASTRRWFDRGEGVWKDGRTEWFTVKVWRQAAHNVSHSLRKGDPVVVHGRLSTEEWVAPDGPRTSLVIDAVALGPDLTFGTSHFARTVSPSAAEPRPDSEPADVSGLPEVDADGDLVPAEHVEDTMALAAVR